MAWWIWILIVIGIIAVLFIAWYISFSIGVSKAKKEQEEVKRVGGLDSWLENSKRQREENEKRMERANRVIKQMEKSYQKNSIFSASFNSLEQQLKQNLFSDSELEEVLKDKQLFVDISTQATNDTNQLTALINKQIEIGKKELALIKKTATKERSEQISILSTDQGNLDIEIEAILKNLVEQDKTILASHTKIEQWVALGKSREGK